jgi:hypothetical protein
VEPTVRDEAAKHMGLVHAGKIDEAIKLGTKEAQDWWKAKPDADRNMDSEMMKKISLTEAQFSAEIKVAGRGSADRRRRAP